MRRHSQAILPAALLLWVVMTVPARAAGRVELTLGVEKGAPLTAQQTWARDLGQAGVRNVRIRQQRGSDRMMIEVRGTKASPIYAVTGTLNARGEVMLPGARFRRGDASRLARWLKDLAQQGPPEAREPTSAFGLPRSQYAEVRKDLAPPVDFSTKSLSRGEVLKRIRDRLVLPMRIDPALLSALDKDVLDEELLGLSRGTALAHAVRAPGLSLIVHGSARGPEYVISEARPSDKTWPLGHEPKQSRSKALPALFEFHTINIEDVSVAKVLEAVAARLKVPILLDHVALARHGIDPAKTRVTIPRGRTTYGLILRKALFQSRLKHELRVDDSGKPFIWVTSIKS